MPSKEIKELRQQGNLEAALEMAKAECIAEPDSIWPKRNISWVYYEYLKLNAHAGAFNEFLGWLKVIRDLNFTEEEKLLFGNVAWQIGKMGISMGKVIPLPQQQAAQLFEVFKSFHFPKGEEGYSFLYKAFHKLFKGSTWYIPFADWWDFGHFRPEDWQKEKLENGREMMALVEQAYIAYAKQLLPGQAGFDREKAAAFLPRLEEVVENHPEYQYPPYFQAKLLLALGNRNNMLEALLPFARKKKNDFWVWEVIAEAFSADPDIVLACYCRALLCKSPKEMLVSLRQKLAIILIDKGFYNEARTEINTLIEVRSAQGYNIPPEFVSWVLEDWYQQASDLPSNLKFYKQFASKADAILYSDVPEVKAMVEFVNKDKKMLNFIASEAQMGFFKYERFLQDVKPGDVLKVRFQSGSAQGLHQVYSVEKIQDEAFKSQFMKYVAGKVKIPEGKAFGFIEDAFIAPALVTKYQLTDGSDLTGHAMKSYNKEKKHWGWKLV
jgi:hypothetical protein